ncbi:hypothetical protein BC827DRAFT_1162851 [Russula dissimulans]|nr:hypothetical protein BC827DRAFT_1162851 [Russula dissimulans]
MSQVFYSDFFTDSIGDERPYTYTSTIGTSTLGTDDGPVQTVEFPPFMGGPGHGLWSNEHPSTPGPSSASHTNTTEHDSLPHSITVGCQSLAYTHATLIGVTSMKQLAGHHGNQMNHDDYQVPIASGALQLEYYASMPPMPEVPSDGPLGYVPILENIAGPSGDDSSPVHSGISDDEDLKRLAKRYLNNRRAHVDKLLVRRRFQGGRRVLILLEIYVPILDNIAGPSGDNSSPVHSGISDDEDLKRLAKRYLNNRRAHVDKLLVRRRFQGGRRVLILLEIDDTM